MYTYRFNYGYQILVEALFVGVGNGTQLIVVSLRKDAADENLVRARLALGGSVQLHDVGVNLLRNDGSRVLCAVGGQDHHEVALRLHAEIALNRLLEAAAEGLVIGLLDGVEVGVGARQQDVVEDELLGAGAAHGVEEVVDVGQERAAGQLQQTTLQVSARFRLDVLNQVTFEVSVEGFADGVDLQRVLVGKDVDQRLFVSAEALHGAAERLRVAGGIPVDVLRRTVAERGWCRRARMSRRRSAVLTRRRRTTVRRRLVVATVLAGRRLTIVLRRRRLAVALLVRRRILAGRWLVVAALLRRILLVLRRVLAVRRRVLTGRRLIVAAGRRRVLLSVALRRRLCTRAKSVGRWFSIVSLLLTAVAWAAVSLVRHL